MSKKITTSISLPVDLTRHWRKKSRNILNLAERYLRIMMRSTPNRGTARRYNVTGTEYAIVTIRLKPGEYDTLHYVAATLRVSVSLLLSGLIKFWLKPQRREHNRSFVTNYSWNPIKWDPEAGIIKECITFWRIPPTHSFLKHCF